MDQSDDISSHIVNKFKLANIKKAGEAKAPTEDVYNTELRKNNGEVIVAHRALPDRIEIADVIVEDGNNTYLFHNKNEFNSGSARDVLGQIGEAARLIYAKRFLARPMDFFEKRFNSIKNLYKPGRDAELRIKNATELQNLFGADRTLIFVAGITRMNHQSLHDSNSNLAKSLAISTRQDLLRMGFRFAVVGLEA